MAKKRVEIISEQDIFKKFIFRITEARLRYERYNGKMSDELTRLCFVRGDSVAILMHDPQAHTLILTEQFRYPTYRAGSSAENGWLLEIPAGSVEPGELPESTVRREVQEEIGYILQAFKPISTFYVSPGGTSERILLYYAQISPKDRTSKGGGVLAEGEDVRTVVMSVRDALAKIESGELRDAKSIIALQWLQLRFYPPKP
ncbi:MAG: NUDIX domain-containing protein [Armatimonadetes bacterium]|nr:NUDIX domain-containing protein [Anaerolineae bacterium]